VYILGAKLPNGYHASFETLTDEQARQGLLDAWATTEQQIYNLTHTTCPTCNGRGVERHKSVYKVGGQTKVRFEYDNCGCSQCHGTGAVLK
jgi:hypothetical protein